MCRFLDAGNEEALQAQLTGVQERQGTELRSQDGALQRHDYPLNRLPASRLLLPRRGLERSDFVLWPIAEQPFMSDVRSTADSDSRSMKFITDHPFADPEVAARKISNWPTHASRCRTAASTHQRGSSGAVAGCGKCIVRLGNKHQPPLEGFEEVQERVLSS